MPKTEKKSVVWIDCAKFLAILAVLIDHEKNSVRRRNDPVHFLLSVSVFFFCPNDNLVFPGTEEGGGNIRPLDGKEAVADHRPVSCGCGGMSVFKSGFTLSLGPYILWALNFNLEGQFYFVLIYLQLIAAAPVLYLLTVFCRRGRFSFLWRSGYLAAALALSLFCVKHSTALQTYEAETICWEAPICFCL